jgi:hypothetical protein
MTGGSFSTNVRLDSGATFQQRGGGKRGTVFRPPSPEADLNQEITDAEAAAANAKGLACTLNGHVDRSRREFVDQPGHVRCRGGKPTVHPKAAVKRGALSPT